MLETLTNSLTPIRTPASKLAKISDRLGVAGLYLFAFFSLLSIAGANLGLGLMIIALALSADAWRRLPRQPLFWLCLLIIGYIALRTVWSTGEIAAAQKTQINQARDWALLFVFFIPAWWLSQSPNRITVVLTLMFSGFCLGIIGALDGETLARIQQGARSGLHFGKPIIFGFDCAAAILALMTLAAYWLNPQLDHTRSTRTIRVGLTVVAMLFFTQGLIISQSRGVWLSILFALPVVFLTLNFGRPAHRRTTHQLRTPFIAILAVIAVIAVILSLNWHTVSQRISIERQALGIVVTEGLEKAPLGSSTYRLHLWRFGLQKWLERPLLGWGPGTTHTLVEAKNDIALQDPPGSSFDHLHNAYLEAVFQLGLIGFVLIALICGLIFSMVMENYRRKRLSVYFLAFLLSNFVLIAVYSLTDFRHLHWNWRFYWLIIAAVAYAFALSEHRPSITRSAR
ncbi:MAG: O-antigen ligase family protein [Candidatus Thiodiazotropha sp. (ex Epidulcina cf. delphinae)]|nr:O-antigen ligase family protein [Candidatus Thiodiazotropha sp. (ex Epidulcina cf. delphinae)]